MFKKLALLGCVVTACATAPKEPYVLVLGTAQDGGLPQIGCTEYRCLRARRGVGRRLVSSLMLIDPRTDRRWLFDASPDLREQMTLVPLRAHQETRPPLVEGVFLTHAHIGHYTGLMHLGREAYGAKKMPVYGTELMLEFLRANGPWSQLVALEQIDPRPVVPDQSIAIADDISVVAISVPHRDELSDTVAFIIRGPKRTLLYLPDIDKWERWDRKIEEVVASVDVALLDGTFFQDGEIPGRSISEIPHPFITESIERFASLPPEERDKIWFTHLNHTNPAADTGGSSGIKIRRAGMHVARDLLRFEL